MITSLYRPRTLFEALRDIASAARAIWGDYRQERGYQRATRRRLRKDLRDFEVRCGRGRHRLQPHALAVGGRRRPGLLFPAAIVACSIAAVVYLVRTGASL